MAYVRSPKSSRKVKEHVKEVLGRTMDEFLENENYKSLTTIIFLSILEYVKAYNEAAPKSKKVEKESRREVKEYVKPHKGATPGTKMMVEEWRKGREEERKRREEERKRQDENSFNS
nr:uncharacterized protein LOC131795171 [Pocillopora verrucosa]